MEVSLLVNQPTSCLTTTLVSDMRAIEKADVLVMNGAGLEDFMGDALAASDGGDRLLGGHCSPCPPWPRGHDHDTSTTPHLDV